jgi:hypothetical protein
MRGVTVLLPAFLLLCVPHSGFAQGSTKTLQFNEVGWTLHIPPGTPLHSDQVDSLIKVTPQSTQQHGGTPPDFSGMRVLFSFVDPPYNTFASAITHFHANLYPSWIQYHERWEKGVLQQLEAMKPRLLVKDTASDTAMIDGLVFQRYYYKTYYPQSGLTLQTYLYARLVRGYDFMVTISYTDEQVGQQFLSILQGSTFKR